MKTNLRSKVDENLNSFCDNQPSELREYDEYKKSAIGLMSSFVQRSQPTNLFLISILSKSQLRILTFRQNWNRPPKLESSFSTSNVLKFTVSALSQKSVLQLPWYYFLLLPWLDFFIYIFYFYLDWKYLEQIIFW